jgi:hypothetical protein
MKNRKAEMIKKEMEDEKVYKIMQKQKDELTREKNYEEKEDGRGEREMEEI